MFFYLFMLIKTSKSTLSFFSKTFGKLYQNWLIWRILQVKKKNVFFSNISEGENIENKKNV